MHQEADRARANAIPLELKKDGLQQRQSGDWVLRVVVQAADMHQNIINAPMGTRFQAALVEIDDDETPVQQDAKMRQAWRDIGPTKQAGIRCCDPVFHAFLSERMPYGKINDEKGAALAVRNICGIETRADLSKPGFSEQRLAWAHLDNAFEAWRALENGR
jgi:hypothetical protein